MYKTETPSEAPQPAPEVDAAPLGASKRLLQPPKGEWGSPKGEGGPLSAPRESLSQQFEDGGRPSRRSSIAAAGGGPLSTGSRCIGSPAVSFRGSRGPSENLPFTLSRRVSSAAASGVASAASARRRSSNKPTLRPQSAQTDVAGLLIAGGSILERHSNLGLSCMGSTKQDNLDIPGLPPRGGPTTLGPPANTLLPNRRAPSVVDSSTRDRTRAPSILKAPPTCGGDWAAQRDNGTRPSMLLPQQQQQEQSPGNTQRGRNIPKTGLLQILTDKHRQKQNPTQ